MKRWQFWSLKNCPSADKREHIISRWEEDSRELCLLHKAPDMEHGVYMARLYVNPNRMESLARDIADLISEAQKVGYLEAQRDMRRAMGIE